MGVLLDQEGRTLQLFVDNYRYYNISVYDFSPTEDPSPDLTAEQIGAYVDKGFLVMPHSDGIIYCITWRDWVANGKKLTIAAGGIANLTPHPYKGKDSVWIPCRVVKVYASNDGTYASIPTTINIDLPL